MALLQSICFSTTPFQAPSSSAHRPSATSITSLSFPTTSISKPHLVKSLKFQSFHCYCSPSASPSSVAELEPAKNEEVGDAGVPGAGGSRLIAQNVPWSCTIEDVRALFEKYGTVVDIELSMHSKGRNRGLAFVTMGSPEEALEALNNLEGLEYQGRILKIAYAKSQKKQSRPPQAAKAVSPYNLFVGNLSYEARAKDLREFFGSDGAKVVSAEVIFHENPRRASGYGFVSFRSKEAAEAALTAFDGKTFLDRPIRVSRSKRFAKLSPTQKAEEETPTTSDTVVALET